MNVNFNESAIPNNLTQMLMENGAYEWDQTMTKPFYQILFTTFSDFLRKTKKKGQKTGLKIQDLKGNFLLGAVVEYIPNENEDLPGSWSYDMSFDEKIVEDAVIYTNMDNAFYEQIERTGWTLLKVEFDIPSEVSMMSQKAAIVLKQWLDMNARDDEEVVLTLDNLFTAKVKVVAGLKELSLIPDGSLRTLIKDDAAK